MGMLDDFTDPFVDYYNKLVDVNEGFESGDRNTGEFVLGTVGATGGLVGDIAGTALDYLVPDSLGVGEKVAEGVRYLANTEGGKYVTKEWQDFKEEYPKEARAAVEAFNSLDLLGLKGAAMKNLPTKGMLWTEGKVYIPGFYRPADVNFNDYLPLGKTLDLEKRITDRASQQVADAARKGLGFGSWLKDGVIRGTKSILSPESRALFAEHGINRVDLEAIQRYRKASAAKEAADAARAKGEISGTDHWKASNEFNLAQENLQAQMQATAHIRRQAGHNDAASGNMINDVALAGADPRFVKFNKGSPYMSLGAKEVSLDGGTTWFKEMVEGGELLPSAGRGDFTDLDAMVMQRHIIDQQKPRAGSALIVKRPSSAQTGNHYKDVFSTSEKGIGQNEVIPAVVRIFKNKQKYSVDELYEALQLQQKVKDKAGKWHDKFTVVNGEIKEVDYEWLKEYKGQKAPQNFSIKFPKGDERNARGVWVNSSMTGSAKTEGAVNLLHRIDPDGNMLGMMSDKHDFDFVEQFAPAGKALSKALPKDVIGITAPLRANIFTVGNIERKGRGRRPKVPDKGDFSRPRGVQDDKLSLKQEILNRADAIEKLKPSPEAVAAQRRYLATKGMLLAPAAASGISSNVAMVDEEGPLRIDVYGNR